MSFNNPGRGRMPKEDKVELQGEVVEVLPNAMFRIKVPNNNEDHMVLATLSGRMRTNNINVLLHDLVTVEVSVYDLSKGRITFRKKGKK